MKKILTIIVMSVIAFTACRKKDKNVSMPFTPSYPVVKITSDTFFTIPVLGNLPNTVKAKAYDTFYKKSLDSVLVYDYSGVDVTTPGLYSVIVSAKNQTGYIGYAYAYVNVVTSLTSLVNFTGRYKHLANGDTVYVTPKISQSGDTIIGFYNINNVAGLKAYYDTTSHTDSTMFVVPAYFIQLNNTQIVLPAQYSPLGLISGINASCVVAPADTAFQYQVINKSYGPSMRIFKKF